MCELVGSRLVLDVARRLSTLLVDAVALAERRMACDRGQPYSVEIQIRKLNFAFAVWASQLRPDVKLAVVFLRGENPGDRVHVGRAGGAVGQVADLELGQVDVLVLGLSQVRPNRIQKVRFELELLLAILEHEFVEARRDLLLDLLLERVHGSLVRRLVRALGRL